MEIQEYAIALASFREALRIRRKSLGSKHPLVIRLLNNIGCALFEMNNLDDARVAFEEALDLQRGLMRENSLGEKCPSTSESLKGNKDTNEIGQDLELEEEIDPREAHNMLLSIALTLCNLGSIHLRWGMYDQSLAFYEEALLVSISSSFHESDLLWFWINIVFGIIINRYKSQFWEKTTTL
jgi:tetratricopeptide (TPR) repeat protein